MYVNIHHPMQTGMQPFAFNVVGGTHHVISLASHGSVEVGRSSEVQESTGKFSIRHYNDV